MKFRGVKASPRGGYRGKYLESSFRDEARLATPAEECTTVFLITLRLADMQTHSCPSLSFLPLVSFAANIPTTYTFDRAHRGAPARAWLPSNERDVTRGRETPVAPFLRKLAVAVD